MVPEGEDLVAVVAAAVQQPLLGKMAVAAAAVIVVAVDRWEVRPNRHVAMCAWTKSQGYYKPPQQQPGPRS